MQVTFHQGLLNVCIIKHKQTLLQELYKKSKEYSDIPDLISSRGKKGGPFKKATPTAAPSKSSHSDEESTKMETDDDANGDHSNNGSAIKAKRKLSSEDEEAGTSSPAKKEKRDVSKPDVLMLNSMSKIGKI